MQPVTTTNFFAVPGHLADVSEFHECIAERGRGTALCAGILGKCGARVAIPPGLLSPVVSDVMVGGLAVFLQRFRMGRAA